MTVTPLLEIHDLATSFRLESGTLRAVDGVSLRLEAGRSLGLVGESGCGKSVTALSVMRLVPDPPGRIERGRILWQGRDLLRLHWREMPDIRGREIAMIFQDPMTSLNPVFTIGRQLIEPLARHRGVKGAEARRRGIEALERVGLPDPGRRFDQYPHELSGGMKQRVMIAMALLLEPRLLIADEPTTALDVTIQAQILGLIRELQRSTGMALLLITHDLGVVAETCDDVAVMYAGRIVEQASAGELFARPRHPYTRGLLLSRPAPGLDKTRPLPTIEGAVPSMIAPPPGCRFAERCFQRAGRCEREDPVLRPANGAASHAAACHFPLGGGDA